MVLKNFTKLKNISVKKFKGYQNNGFDNIKINLELYSNDMGILIVDGLDKESTFYLELEVKKLEKQETSYSFWEEHLEYYNLPDAKFFYIKEIDLLNKNKDMQNFLKQFVNYFGYYEVVYSETKAIMYGFYNNKDNIIILSQQNQNFFDSFDFN